MTVYVDSLRVYPPAKEAQARRVGARNGNRWAHMWADTDEELHEFAHTLGLKRAWFQGDHYDLVPARHAAALLAGAQLANRDAVKCFVRRRRAARKALLEHFRRPGDSPRGSPIPTPSRFEPLLPSK
ncbi:MAG: DUF4031 domain-containing protein [Polyangia bacterium]